MAPWFGVKTPWLLGDRRPALIYRFMQERKEVKARGYNAEA